MILSFCETSKKKIMFISTCILRPDCACLARDEEKFSMAKLLKSARENRVEKTYILLRFSDRYQMCIHHDLF